jgi:hypothetical protein
MSVELEDEDWGKRQAKSRGTYMATHCIVSTPYYFLYLNSLVDFSPGSLQSYKQNHAEL